MIAALFGPDKTSVSADVASSGASTGAGLAGSPVVAIAAVGKAMGAAAGKAADAAAGKVEGVAAGKATGAAAGKVAGVAAGKLVGAAAIGAPIPAAGASIRVPEAAPFGPSAVTPSGDIGVATPPAACEATWPTPPDWTLSTEADGCADGAAFAITAAGLPPSGPAFPLAPPSAATIRASCATPCGRETALAAAFVAFVGASSCCRGLAAGGSPEGPSAERAGASVIGAEVADTVV
jgi:hypothetical protein